MKIIDRYIIRKFLGTLAFMLVLLSVIVVVIDVQSKAPRIENNGYTVGYFLLHYYPYWMVYLIITFMSILVFISVIFFTSRMANNTEIVAVVSSGASFHRFARPYFITSLLLAVMAFFINHYGLPRANVKKNKLEAYVGTERKKQALEGDVEIATKLTPDTYLFIFNYNRKSERGTGMLWQKFDKNGKLLHQISANDIYWDPQKQRFVLSNFYERKAGEKDTQIISDGDTKMLDFGRPPKELFPDELSAQSKTTPELRSFIREEKLKGNGNLTTNYIELYQRTSMPVSIIILSVLALSLSSQKKRGGLGINLAIGIALAFVFIFSFEALKVVAEHNTIPPMLAMWLPNIVFAPVAFYLYWKRANQ